jgi:mono/diheme cytochrome c family protein
MKVRALLPASLAVAALAAACNVGTPIEDYPCPPGGTTLTYENFGEDFFAAYCIQCHGGPNGYSGRSFTSLEDIRDNATRIFINAAADNTYMPPGPDGPPQVARDALADWLACGAP